ncbi:hypothetical protein C0195_01170 [Candidatus Bathyarchaeota archaeon]|nr:MAG: hypothetical protein C0195_01170 [Candidatus Bathyarchaeota archaeon]
MAKPNFATVFLLIIVIMIWFVVSFLAITSAESPSEYRTVDLNYLSTHIDELYGAKVKTLEQYITYAASICLRISGLAGQFR